MFYLKACPKCKAGAVRLIVDWDGQYFQCLNCGYTLEIRPTVASLKHLETHLGKSLGSGQPITGGEGVAA